MTDLVIALCQLAPAGLRPQASLEKALVACTEAAERGADVVVLPELWQIGYRPCPDEQAARAAWQGLAIGLDDRWIAAFRDTARELDIAILVTFLERWPGAPHNTALLVDRHGETVLRYAKVHTCDFSMEAALTPGDDFKVTSLDTRSGPVQIGVMICYDREFPESARELMLAGAEVILVPNACEMTEDRMGQLRARAFENMVAVALANYPAPAYDGGSCAFDGVAFWPDGRGARDHQLVRAGPDEGIVYAQVDLDLLRQYRATETWGDAYRKPYAYRRISSPGVAQEVFARPDSRRVSPPDHGSLT
ncbi:MAG: carbon-nitrogen hydrolase family protein [Candidatus Dormibacteria bacterium]